MSTDKFCPACGNMYKMRLDEELGLLWKCTTCGIEKQQQGGCLLVETLIQEKSSEGYRILMNEFTRQDPTLPHVHNIKCPNGACASNTSGVEKDVIYIKYDPVNMKYLYLCNVPGCNTTWRSRG